MQNNKRKIIIIIAVIIIVGIVLDIFINVSTDEMKKMNEQSKQKMAELEQKYEQNQKAYDGNNNN